jgi:hypothetical protein
VQIYKSAAYYRGRLSFLYLRINEVFLPAIIGHGNYALPAARQLLAHVKGRCAEPALAPEIRRSPATFVKASISPLVALAELFALEFGGRGFVTRGETEIQLGCSVQRPINIEPRYDPDRDIRRTALTRNAFSRTVHLTIISWRVRTRIRTRRR